jgi:hypothetical protein
MPAGDKKSEQIGGTPLNLKQETPGVGRGGVVVGINVYKEDRVGAGEAGQLFCLKVGPRQVELLAHAAQVSVPIACIN